MRHLAAVIICGLLISLLLACIGFLPIFEVPFWLLFGWARFLWRVAPEITMNWIGLLTAIVCLALLMGGSQLLLQSLARQMPNPGTTEDAPARRWPFRWTLSLIGVVVLMFVAGISAVGITHQTAWLINSPEPLVDSSSEAANRMMSSNRIKQIVLAGHNYQDDHGTLPPGATFDAHGRALHSWQTFLLPYLEQQKDLNLRINFKVAWNEPENRHFFETPVQAFLDPAVKASENASGFALSHYAANARLLGGDVPRSLKNIPDGTSNTIFAGEAEGNYKPWGYPANWRDPALGIHAGPDSFGGPFPGGAVFAFADGSVHFLVKGIDPKVLKALSTPDGGEEIKNFDD